MDNGNLQIAELTSVAIDPFSSNHIIQNKPVDQPAISIGSNWKYVEDPVVRSSIAPKVDPGALPKVPAYSIVIDRRPSLGTATGKLYVATNVGVFVSAEAGRDILLGGTGQDTQTAHELGHTLGFRHEHTRPTSNSPGVGDVTGDGFDDIIVFGLGTVARYNTVSGRVTGIAVDPSDPVSHAGDDWLSGGDGRDELESGYIKIKKLSQGG